MGGGEGAMPLGSGHGSVVLTGKRCQKNCKHANKN